MVLSTWLVAAGEWEDRLLTYLAGWLGNTPIGWRSFEFLLYIHKGPR
jgi:hypothetical protein